MNKKSIIITLLVILSTFIFPTYAISAGISPEKISINDAHSEGYYNLTFVVYNTGNKTTNYSIKITGDMSNWIYLDKTNITVNANSNYPTKAVIKVPPNTNIGLYKSAIIIKSIPDSSTKGNAVSISIGLPITLNMSSQSSTTKINNTLNSTTNISTSTPITPLLIEPIFSILVGIIVIIVIGAGYYLLGKYLDNLEK